MKIYTPDPCTPYRLCVYGRYCALDGAEEVLVDVGFAAARQGVGFSEYVNFVKRVWQSTRATLYVVVPDVFSNWRKTRENYLKYARDLRRFGHLVYVAQEFVLPRDVDADVIALPAHRQGPYECSRHPLFCAFNVKWFLEERYNGEAPVHLLGPAKLELLHLKMWGTLSKIRSIDTATYRRAPTRRAKEMLGGKWQVVKGLECAWFQEWTRGLI